MGEGRDFVQYVVNAPVAINGGDGFDRILLIGTEGDDKFVITANGIYGGGRYITYVEVETVEVDGQAGDDRFFVLSTAPGVQVRLFGSLGSDTINVAGDAPAVEADDLLGHNGLIEHFVTSAEAFWTGIAVDGIAADIADDDEPAIVLTESERLDGGVRARRDERHVHDQAHAPADDRRRDHGLRAGGLAVHPADPLLRARGLARRRALGAVGRRGLHARQLRRRPDRLGARDRRSLIGGLDDRRAPAPRGRPAQRVGRRRNGDDARLERLRRVHRRGSRRPHGRGPERSGRRPGSQDRRLRRRHRHRRRSTSPGSCSRSPATASRSAAWASTTGWRSRTSPSA